MPMILIDRRTAGKLEPWKEPVELCTVDGIIIGYFTPTVPKIAFEPATEEELNRRFAVGGGSSLKDIIRRFESKHLISFNQGNDNK